MQKKIGARPTSRRVPRKTPSDRTVRRRLIQQHWDEIERIAMGMQSGQLEAFEVFGKTLDDLIGNAAQADMYMAVLLELLPPEAQRKMLEDRRLSQSETVLPILKLLRDKTKRPRQGRS